MDPTDAPGNFINPDYATPQQIAQLRAYAAQLMGQQSPQMAGSWTQALAMGLSPLVGQMKLNQANQLQRQGLQLGQSETDAGVQGSSLIRLLMGGQSNQQAQQGAAAPTPGQQPQSNSYAGEPRGIRNNNPGNIKDSPYAKQQPGYAGSDGTFAIYDSPEHGQQAMTNLLGNYGQKGLNTPESIVNRWAPPSENNSSSYAQTVAQKLGVQPTSQLNMTDPQTRMALASAMAGVENGRSVPMGGQTQMAQNNPSAVSHLMVSPWVPQQIKDAVLKGNTPEAVKDVYGQPGYQTPVGGIRPAPVGQGFQPGVMAPTSVSTPNANISTSVPLTPPGQSGGAPSYGGGQGLGGLQPLINSAQKFGQQSAASGEVNNQIKSDVQTAFNAIPVQQTLRTMQNDIEAHGDKMVFGPTADWLNNFKRAIAQHAPGFLSESDLSGLASADSFEKLSAQLQTLVGRQVGSTDASLFQGMKSVPGSHNSKEGALALIKMLDQVAGINSQFMQENFGRLGQMSPGDYLQAKNEFYTQHPIINPLSGQPIRLDLQGKGAPQSEQQTKTLNGKTYFKINGIWHEGS